MEIPTSAMGAHGGKSLSPSQSSNEDQRMLHQASCVLYFRPIGGGGGNVLLSLRCIRLVSGRVYTIGRDKRRCDVFLGGRFVSRFHCQLLLHASDQMLRLVDGFYPYSRRSGSGGGNTSSGQVPRASLNGVFVNGLRLRRGASGVLLPGDEVLFGCKERASAIGFVVERIVYLNRQAHQVFDFKSSHAPNVALLLQRCRSVLWSSEPLSCLAAMSSLDIGKRAARKMSPPAYSSVDALPGVLQKPSGTAVENTDPGVLLHGPIVELNQNASITGRFESNGKYLSLNRLEFMGGSLPDHGNGVSLPELLYPVESLLRIFITTFTSDIAWFLTYCGVPNHLPVTVACHNSERCWSSRPDSRTEQPLSSYPNLLLIYPPFPDVIAFGKDKNKKGVACHHPKLMVLQREKFIRVVLTSANLVPKQWNNITNTVWWQDFPRRHFPEFAALFRRIECSISDFAAQLAGFLASLVTDVPNQAFWIAELSEYDFSGAVGYLVASIPGLYEQNCCYSFTNRCLLAKETICMHPSASTFIGSVQASVVGLSYCYRSVTDTNGAQLRTLASFLRKSKVNACGLSEVLMRRNKNIPADDNALSILIADLDDFSEGGILSIWYALTIHI